MMEKLRIWWIPQVPMNAFKVDINSIKEAKNVLHILAEYDKFQFENNIKPDYSNTGGLEYFDEDNKEWSEFEDDEGNDIWNTNLIDTSRKLKDLKEKK